MQFSETESTFAILTRREEKLTIARERSGKINIVEKITSRPSKYDNQSSNRVAKLHNFRRCNCILFGSPIGPNHSSHFWIALKLDMNGGVQIFWSEMRVMTRNTNHLAQRDIGHISLETRKTDRENHCSWLRKRMDKDEALGLVDETKLQSFPLDPRLYSAPLCFMT